MKKCLKVSFIMLVAIITILSGCNSKQNNSSSDAKNGKIVIDFWAGPTYKDVNGVKSPEFGDYEKAKIAEFEKEHPNIKINFQLVAWDDIEQKTTVALTGKNPPDVILESLDRRLIKYVKMGSMEPVNDFIEGNKDDFQNVMIDPLTTDGKLYGVPISMNPEYVFLNKKLFEKKGLENLIPQDRDWTFDEMKDALKQVSGDGVYGTAFFAGNEQADEMQLMYLFGMGAQQWNEDSSKVVMADSPEAAETIQMMKDMVKEGVAAPGPATTDILGVLEMFKQGKIAMMPFAQSLYSTIEAGQKDGSVSKDVELYAIKPPHAEGVSPTLSIAGIHGYAVFKQEDKEKREAIKEFVQFMTSTENVKGMAQSANYVPSRKSSSFDVTNKDLTEIMKMVGDLPSGNLGKSNPSYNEVRALWFPALQAALLDKMTPEEAVEDYTKKANKILSNQ
jgi:multiple sugar transport system substrate-binding protein